MPTVEELIKQYGETMYLAGVREKEDDCSAIIKKANDLFQMIVWMVKED